MALRRITTLELSDIYVSFNASTHSLAESSLVEDMVWTAAELQTQPERLAVEVLVTVFFAPDATASIVAEQISHIRAAGFVALLDDFGFGYAGLAHLGQLDVNGLKIDGFLVRKITNSRSEAVIVRAIFQTAQYLDLGLSVVAEGVEDAEMAATPVESDGTFAQGKAIISRARCRLKFSKPGC